MPAKFYRIAVVLGLLSAIGPFAIDMYLPALPTIGEDLGASTAAVQMSLLIFFLATAVGQLAVGRSPTWQVARPRFMRGFSFS